MTRYTIPAGTETLIAPDDNSTPYRKHTARNETECEYRDRFGGWYQLTITGQDIVILIDEDKVRIEK